MGLSTALLLPPSSLATTANFIGAGEGREAGSGGIYSTHIRDEGEYVFQAVDEAIQVGKGARYRRRHPPHENRPQETVGEGVNEVIGGGAARARCRATTFRPTSIRSTAGQNNLSSIVPPWAHDGGRARMIERLADPAARGCACGGEVLERPAELV